MYKISVCDLRRRSSFSYPAVSCISTFKNFGRIWNARRKKKRKLSSSSYTNGKEKLESQVCANISLFLWAIISTVIFLFFIGHLFPSPFLNVYQQISKKIYWQRQGKKLTSYGGRKHRFYISFRYLKSLGGEVSPHLSFCIVQNIKSLLLTFRKFRFSKIATSEKISRATFSKSARLQNYWLLFL